MHWLQENAVWLAPAIYAFVCEIIAHSPLKSNSIVQLAENAIKAILPKAKQ